MDIDIISKIFILPVLLIALGTVYAIAPLTGIEVTKHRYSSIDGLRAFLAMFVFLHHSAIWYYFSHIHQWSHIPSNLYNHFGSTSVAFFFMITAFLFISKLIDSFSNTLDWTKLYISRIMRIMPLYVTNVFILTLIIGFISNFSLKESFLNLFLHILQWVFFMEPDINKIKGTKYINSGVHWSLTYEWVFYCSLALIGWLFFRIRTSYATICLTIIFLFIFIIIINEYYAIRVWKRMMPFIPGFIAAFIVRNEKVRNFFSKESFIPILVLLLSIVLFRYPTVFEPIPYLCLTIIFIAIACGNTLFGILTSKPCLLLGQISYSIYLLHGFILFITFYIAIGFEKAGKLSLLTYWVIICICSAVMVILCSLSYLFVEKPGIRSSEYITNKVIQFFIKRKKNNRFKPAT